VLLARAVRLDDLIEGEDEPDLDREPVLDDERLDEVDRLDPLRLLLLGEGDRGSATERGQPECVGLRAGDDRREARTIAEELDRLERLIGAREVEGDREARRLDVAEPLEEPIAVRDGRRPELADALEAARRARRDDLGAPAPRELDRRLPDGARARVDEDAVARADAE